MAVDRAAYPAGDKPSLTCLDCGKGAVQNEWESCERCEQERDFYGNGADASEFEGWPT